MVLGGQLQSPRRHHGQLGHFADHGAQAAMTKGLFAHGQQRLVVAGLDMDDAVGRKSCLRQARREKVGLGDAPQHLACRARRDAGGEQPGRRAVDDAVAVTGDFVQRPQRQPAAGQAIIDRGYTERQHAGGAPAAVERLNALAQLGESRL